MFSMFSDNTPDFKKFVKTISRSKKKEEALTELNELIKKHGTQFLGTSTIELSKESDDEIKYYASPLFLAVMYSNQPVVSRLLECGAPIDKGAVCSTDPSMNNYSPLMLACKKGYSTMVAVLLTHDPDLFLTNSESKSILMFVKTETVCELIINNAKQKKCLDKLLALTNHNGDLAHNIVLNSSVQFLLREAEHSLVYDFLIEKDENRLLAVLERINQYNITRNKFIKYLLNIDDDIQSSVFICCIQSAFIKIIARFETWGVFEYELENSDRRHLLAVARSAYWTFPEKRVQMDRVCRLLRVKLIDYPALGLINNSPVGFAFAYCTIFGFKADSNVKLVKIKTAVAKFFALLQDANKCIPYLKFLNQELLRYFAEKHKTEFPVLDETTYEFKPINGVIYPIPKSGSSYEGIHKFQALQELLIILFQKYGLANHAYKWIGYIPHEIANKMVKRGDMLTESRLGSGLFHNKLAHMLQWLLLIYAIENGVILLDDISIKDIFEALVTIKNKDDRLVWERVLDVRTNNATNFSDPHRLGSIIMRYGRELEMQAVADTLIDSFCKGFLGLFQIFQNNNFYNDVTHDVFVEHLRDIQIEIFGSAPFIFGDAMRSESSKGTLDTECEIGEDYACVKKYYTPLETFEPRAFRDSERSVRTMRD